MTKIQKILLGGVIALIIIGLSALIFDYQDNNGRRDRKMSQNLDNLRKIRKQKPRNPNKDYFPRKEDMLWGGGKSGGREREIPKTPFDDLINN